jgi:uncharacterized CHY-type Zn-finger protein
MKEEQLKAIAKHMTELYDRAEQGEPQKKPHRDSQLIFCGWCLERLYYQENTASYHCINCSETQLVEQ